MIIRGYSLLKAVIFIHLAPFFSKNYINKDVNLLKQTNNKIGLT
jgi:hypothetical protein